MIRFFLITLLACLAVTTVSCNESRQDKPIWENTKITDLAPARSSDRDDKQFLKKVNIDVYTIEIAADKAQVLDKIHEMLYPQPFRFNDHKAFKSNLFSAGFGQNQMWTQIGTLLDSVGATGINPLTLLLFNDMANDMTVSILNKKQTVFYTSSKGEMLGETIGPGKLALRIKAEQLPSSRGVCMVSIKPIFSSLIKSKISRATKGGAKGELVFNSFGFRLKMTPGDFILLGPTKYINNKITLAGHLFYSEERKPVAMIFLLVCRRLNY